MMPCCGNDDVKKTEHDRVVVDVAAAVSVMLVPSFLPKTRTMNERPCCCCRYGGGE